jgi:cyclopropane-fatty-acyl-phospholipid synthase
MSLISQVYQRTPATSLKSKDLVDQLLISQDIRILAEQDALAGVNPWDIVCRDNQRKNVINQFRTFKTLGLGNTYIQGLWHCERIDLLFERLFALDVEGKRNSVIFELPNSPYLLLEQLLYKVFNISLLRQMDVAKTHYDLPIELYEGFLGESMKYTTGDWTGLTQVPENLTAAQNQNLAYWVNELNISDGDVILDCGCGWGTLPDYLKHQFNITYIGITISDVQVDYCRSKFEGLKNYHFFHHSYHNRHQNILAQAGVEQITKCIFLETLEHGGSRNLPHILRNVREVISPDGLLGIQTIGADHPTLICDPYINRYIFQHASLSSPSQLGKAIESNRQFVKIKENNIFENYPATLCSWNHYFQENWDDIKPHIQRILDSTTFKTVDEWKRHWEFYLLMCVGAFVPGTYPQVYQITARPNFFVKL